MRQEENNDFFLIFSQRLGRHVLHFLLHTRYGHICQSQYDGRQREKYCPATSPESRVLFFFFETLTFLYDRVYEGKNVHPVPTDLSAVRQFEISFCPSQWLDDSQILVSAGNVVSRKNGCRDAIFHSCPQKSDRNSLGAKRDESSARFLLKLVRTCYALVQSVQ